MFNLYFTRKLHVKYSSFHLIPLFKNAGENMNYVEILDVSNEFLKSGIRWNELYFT
jgi:hypothetical protein